MSRVLLLVLALAGTPGWAALSGGFLFVTFRGERGADGEQIYFALSADGSQWEATHGGEPALVSELGEKGARDPYLLRGENGKFYLLATDLSIFHHPDWKRAVRAGSRSLLIWESDDLAHWSEPRLVPVAPPDAGCTWAPEAIYDPTQKKYLVYWASTTQPEDFAKHRIWAAWTEDFRTFSAPFVYIDKPTTVIDTTIVRGDDSRYYRFTKDEKFKTITFESSDRITGTWQDHPDFSLSQLKGYEGPTCFVLHPAQHGRAATWCLLLDAYASHAGYKPFTTDNLASGQFTAGTAFTFPFLFRHGSVLALTSEEYARLKTHFATVASKPSHSPR